MANPAFVDCPAGAWTEIATNVLTGIVHMVSNTPNVYKQTYRLTGEAAPTLESDGVVLFDSSVSEDISSAVPIDVYVWCVNEAGRVRVDL